MDVDTLLRILTFVGGPTTLVALYKWAVAHGKAQAIAEQTTKTLAAKDTEIAELKAEITQLEGWLDGLTRPPGRSQ